MSDTAHLFDGTGPVASVYLRAPSAHADAVHRFETRWKNARRSLSERGAPADVLDGLDAAVKATNHGDAAAFAFFSGSQGALVEQLDEELRADSVSFDSLPRLIPVLSARQRTVPHVMVVTDRIGADIVSFDADDRTERREVDGDDEHIHRGRFGGWSHRRYQQRAENTWESNAKLVAEEVCEVARSVAARFVTIAGDGRASHLLLERLDTDVSKLAILLEEGSGKDIASATVQAAADIVARDTMAVLNEVADRKSAGTAVSGASPVLNALASGRADTLLIHEDVNDDRRAFFEPGKSPEWSRSRAHENEVEGRMVDIAVRSALLTDAKIRVVPSSAVDEGMAALLRW